MVKYITVFLFHVCPSIGKSNTLGYLKKYYPTAGMSVGLCIYRFTFLFVQGFMTLYDNTSGKA